MVNNPQYPNSCLSLRESSPAFAERKATVIFAPILTPCYDRPPPSSEAMPHQTSVSPEGSARIPCTKSRWMPMAAKRMSPADQRSISPPLRSYTSAIHAAEDFLQFPSDDGLRHALQLGIQIHQADDGGEEQFGSHFLFPVDDEHAAGGRAQLDGLHALNGWQLLPNASPRRPRFPPGKAHAVGPVRARNARSGPGRCGASA